ncbi:hypothetical protein KAH27_10415, partial [bacterium]|nr:hypothetical protein [bacterium]
VREWTVTNIPLIVGTNSIVAYGTNYFDETAFSMIKIYREIPEPCFYLLFICNLGLWIIYNLTKKNHQ